jgi:MFS family permease
MTLGAFLSSLAAGLFAIWFGRKHGLYLACVLSIVSCIIQIATTNKGVVYLGRLLLGAANGFYAIFSTVYLSEAAPTHLRGVITALFKFWIQIGQIIGTVIVNYTKTRLDKTCYQIPLGCLFIIPVFLSIALFFVPESPRYLLYHGKDAEARKALEIIRADSVSQEYIELEWVEMIHGREEENKSAKSESWINMFRGADLRRSLLCYGTIAMQTACGIWFVIPYQTYFFTIVGVTKPFEYSIMNTCLGFAGVVCGMIAMRHFVGRRTILMFGAVASGLCQLSTAIAWSVDATASSTTKVVIGFWAIYYYIYGATVGTATYPVASEVVSNKLRAWTVGSATSLGYVLAWLCNFCTPYFINPTELNWVRFIE